MKSPARSAGKGRGATINVVIAPQGGAPAGIPGGLPPGPMAAPVSMPPRAGLARPPMAAPPMPMGAPPAMKQGGRVMAGAGSGLGRLHKSGR